MFSHAQAPVRIGIAGGGTDLPAWTTSGRTGLCLSLAIKAYTHAVAIERPDRMVVASYLKRDSAPAATEIANGLIRESALMHGWEDGFEVHTLSELSSHGSGLGVSSSIAVALAACFQQMALLKKRATQVPRTGDFMYSMLADAALRAAPGHDHVVWEEDPEARMSIARDAWTVEIDRLRRPIGRQDHMAAAHGGLKLYAFSGTEAKVEQLFSVDDAMWLAKHLMLIKLPDGHDARVILSGVKNPAVLEDAAAAVGIAETAIAKRDLRMLGQALERGQRSKLSIPGAVPPRVQEVLAAIGTCGSVWGFKVAGAGGGGHIVVACEPGSASHIADATNLTVLPVEADIMGVRSEGYL